MILIIVRLGGVEWDAKLEESEGREDDNNQSASKEYGRRTDNDMIALQSNIKRICKLGNEIEFRGLYAESNDVADKNMIETSDVNAPSADWHTWDRFFIDYYLPTVCSPEINLRVCQVLKWNAIQCQSTRAKYFALPSKKQLTINASIKTNDWVNSSVKAAVNPDPVLISYIRTMCKFHITIEQNNPIQGTMLGVSESENRVKLWQTFYYGCSHRFTKMKINP